MRAHRPGAARGHDWPEGPPQPREYPPYIPPLNGPVPGRAPPTLNDIRRSLRLGMGPCQGGFCIYRATGILHGIEQLSGPDANAALLRFLEERWKGVWPILYGDQLRQARFDEWVFQGLLDVEHLPGEVEAAPVPAEAGAPLEA